MKRDLLRAALSGLLPAAAGLAHAQGYQNRPIRFSVPFWPGCIDDNGVLRQADRGLPWVVGAVPQPGTSSGY
jgi:hypothetical protein